MPQEALMLQNGSGQTALHLAAGKGQLEFVRTICGKFPPRSEVFYL